MKPARLTLFAALGLAVLAFFSSLSVGERYFERLPHIEDEMAYAWQARLIAQDFRLTIPSPVCPKCFLIPFVVDHNGLRFGKYPPGWPAALGIAEWLGGRALINPFLAALAVWFTWRLGARVFGPITGLLAAFLVCVSPFFLMNSGSLLSHAWSLFLSLGFVLGWLDGFYEPQSARARGVPPGLAAAVAALCLGGLALTRPLTAVGVALPFGLHALWVLIRGPQDRRIRLVGFGLAAAAVSLLFFWWQFAVSGDPFLNPYTLWWSYDKIGFGPGIGLRPGGNTLNAAWVNTRWSLTVGSHDLFGWPHLSYALLPFGILAGRKNGRTWLLAGLILSLVATYMLYWIGSWLVGPRYYYEALPSAAILTAAGLAWLAGQGGKAVRWRMVDRLRFGLVSLVAMLFIGANLGWYLPERLRMMYGLYGVARKYLEPFTSAEAMARPKTLVIVSPNLKWIEYGRLTDLENPALTSRFIFINDRGEKANQTVIDAFPDRQVWYYKPPVESGDPAAKQNSQ